MSRVKVSWQWADEVTLDQARLGLVKDLIGYQEINCHIIFNAHMDFQKKIKVR